MNKIKFITAILLCVSMTMQAGASTRVVVESGESGIASGTFEGMTEVHGAAVFAKQNAESVKVLDNTTFINNSVNVEGAAIANYGKSLEIGNNVSFKGNTAFLNGYVLPPGYKGDCQLGTLYSEGTNERKNVVTIGNNVAFEDNKAQKGAGIFIFGQHDVTIGDEAKFISNKAQESADDRTPTKSGGAISLVNYYKDNDGNYKTNGHIDFKIGENAKFTNNGAMFGGAIDINSEDINLEIGKGATFTGNTAEGSLGLGGAIHNAGTTKVGDNASFINNSSTIMGGAIYNEKNSMTIENDASFEENTATYGGAISNNAVLNISNDATFKKNYATIGGAICNFKTMTFGEGVKFEENTATLSVGGAIYNQAGTVELSNNAKFIKNNGSFGGAIANYGSFSVANDAIFEGNTATSSVGGAIYNNAGLNFTIGENAKFTGNKSTGSGGSIYNAGNMTIGKKAEFTDNRSSDSGGALYTTKDITLTDANFTGNYAGIYGGAIYNKANLKIADGTEESATVFAANNAHAGGAISSLSGTVDIGDYTKFDSNKTFDKDGDAGGALYISESDLRAGNNVSFINNSALSLRNVSAVSKGAAGAVYVYNSNVNIGRNAEFSGNTARYAAGALYLWNNASYESQIGDNAVFKNNASLSSYAGAIGNFDGKLTIGKNALFEGNYAETSGGAIYNGNFNTDDAALIIGEGAVFSNNTAKTENGGAIYNGTSNALELTDVTFTNNTAGSKGGAIYSEADVTINAKSGNVLFAGNSALSGADIYMDRDTTLKLNTAAGKNITVAGGISGHGEGYKIIIDEITNTSGISPVSKNSADINSNDSVTINSVIKYADINLKKGTLHLAEGSLLESSSLKTESGTTLNTADNKATNYERVTLADNTKLIVDVDLNNGRTDNFQGNNASVIIADINTVGNTTKNNVSINLKEQLGLANIKIDEKLKSKETVILTPIRYLKGSVDDAGILDFTPTGNSYDHFNHAVMAAPVAVLTGSFLGQLNSYDQAFKNLDMFMLLKIRKRHADSNSEGRLYRSSKPQFYSKSIWIRPYSAFEEIKLKNGPKVSNNKYGTFFGIESEMYDLGYDDWNGMFSVYAGYSGSQQQYDGIDISQNGGNIGALFMAYKGNMFAGVTANVGGNTGKIKTGAEYHQFGYSIDDNITTFSGGIAVKTGYNFEFKEGTYVLRPNLLMAYSVINPGNYTSTAGFPVDMSFFGVLSLEPGIKFMCCLKNGWFPYAGINAVWNIMKTTEVTAAGDSLPGLGIKPYTKYGIGTGKKLGEKSSGFIQMHFTGEGKSGINIQAGFRMSV